MDTAKQLSRAAQRATLAPLRTASGKAPTSSPSKRASRATPYPLPGIAWQDSSCWLDTSLQMLYHAISRDQDDFGHSFRSLSPATLLSQDQPVFELFEAILQRFDASTPVASADTLGIEDLTTRSSLTNQNSALRDQLRQALTDRDIIDDAEGSSNLWVRAWSLRSLPTTPI